MKLKDDAIRRPHRLCLLALALIHAGLLAYAGWRHAPTIDEPPHLAAGVSHWHYANFDLYQVNPPLVRLMASLPVLAVSPETDWKGFAAGRARGEMASGNNLMLANGMKSFWYLTLARWACIPFSLLGLFSCYLFARDLYGRAAGLLAATLWCFSPNILSHAALITPDAGAAATGILATYCFWRWLRDPDWFRALVAGLALGLCLSSKFTWIILIPILPALWLFWRATLLQRLRLRGVVSQFAQQCFAMVIALYVINSVFAFQETFLPFKDLMFESETGRKWLDPLQESWLGEVPVPVPRRFPEGIDLQKEANEGGGVNNYLRAEFRDVGWWYYYLYGMLIKVPIGTLALLLLALAMSIVRLARADRKWFWRRKRTISTEGHKDEVGSGTNDDNVAKESQPPPVGFRDVIIMLAPGLLLFALVSSQTEINRHLRYVLPAFPFLFVYLGGCVCPLKQRHGSPGPWRSFLAAALLAYSVISSLMVYPHSQSYFNEFVGGPTNGHNHLLNSNIDWGQEAFGLADFVNAHRQDGPVYVAYFGSSCNLELLGIDQENRLPASFQSQTDEEIPPGWYAISVERLHSPSGLDVGTVRFGKRTPVKRIGYSINVYHVE